MTDKPTPEQIQRACDLANGLSCISTGWSLADYGQRGCLTALADTIAQLDAMQAERDKARADLGEIDRIAVAEGHTFLRATRIPAIAAPYRVETDPLAAEVRAIIAEEHQKGWDLYHDGMHYKDGAAHKLILNGIFDDSPKFQRYYAAMKRGLEIGRSA